MEEMVEMGTPNCHRTIPAVDDILQPLARLNSCDAYSYVHDCVAIPFLDYKNLQQHVLPQLIAFKSSKQLNARKPIL
jgi:hypothetical protein